jgi:hypothetical protein
VVERERSVGGPVATAKRTAAERQGIEAPEPEEAPEPPTAPTRSGNGAAADPESAERRKRNDERRAKRAQRRKGKRR